MDGFHLADVELARRGLLDRKGAPETFDAEGYAALLAPGPRRRGAVHGAGVRPRRSSNRSPGRSPSRPGRAGGHRGQLPAARRAALAGRPRRSSTRSGTCSPTTRARVERLVARHVEFGKTPAEARAWVERVDQPNAVLVEAAAGRADRVLDLTDWGGEVHVAPAGLPPDRVDVEHHVDADEPGEDGLHSYRYEYDLIWITVGSARILARRYSDTPQQASLMSIEENGGRRFIHAVDLTSPLVAAAVAYLSSIGVEDVQRLGGGSGYAPVDL